MIKINNEEPKRTWFQQAKRQLLYSLLGLDKLVEREELARVKLRCSRQFSSAFSISPREARTVSNELNNAYWKLLTGSNFMLTSYGSFQQSKGKAKKRKIMIINGITCTCLRFPYPKLFPLSQKNHYKELKLPFVKSSFNKELPNTWRPFLVSSVILCFMITFWKCSSMVRHLNEA